MEKVDFKKLTPGESEIFLRTFAGDRNLDVPKDGGITMIVNGDPCHMLSPVGMIDAMLAVVNHAASDYGETPQIISGELIIKAGVPPVAIYKKV